MSTVSERELFVITRLIGLLNLGVTSYNSGRGFIQSSGYYTEEKYLYQINADIPGSLCRWRIRSLNRR